MIKKLLPLLLCLAMLAINCPTVQAADTIQPNQLLDIISAAKGKQAVLVNFYASWCAPCRKEIPHMVELRKQFSTDQLIMVAINVDDSAQTMKAFNQANGINYTTYHDTGVLSAMFQVNAIPFTAIYSKSGKLIYAAPNYLEQKQMAELVNQALQK